VSGPQKRLASGLAIAVVLVASVAFGKKRFASPVTDENGRLLIVEYSDYECPHCRVAQPVVKNLLKVYGDKVKWVHNNFPLEMVHKWAKPAAIASECADKQGKFEAYNDLLFDRQDQWSQAAMPPLEFDNYAKEIGLDAAKFAACERDPAVADKVTAERKEGQKLGVQSTPTFFIDGERMTGSKQLEYKAPRIIDPWLAKHSSS
jgi:protein-disulfide isomerase